MSTPPAARHAQYFREMWRMSALGRMDMSYLLKSTDPQVIMRAQQDPKVRGRGWCLLSHTLAALVPMLHHGSSSSSALHASMFLNLRCGPALARVPDAQQENKAHHPRCKAGCSVACHC